MTKQSYDDDGRTIADMSDLDRQPLLLPHLPKRKKENAGPEQPDENQPELQLTQEERRAYLGGAISASMLLAGVFIAVGAIVIILLLLLWH